MRRRGAGNTLKRGLLTHRQSTLGSRPARAYTQAMATALSPEMEIWTEAELQALPEAGYIHEVVGGELVLSLKEGAYHAELCVRMLTALAENSPVLPALGLRASGVKSRKGRLSIT